MGLDGAAATTRGIFTASGLVSVVLPTTAKIDNMAHIIQGRGKAYPVVVLVGVPSFAGNSVENNFVTSSNRCAGAGIFSGVFGYHFCLHGFPFQLNKILQSSLMLYPVISASSFSVSVGRWP